MKKFFLFAAACVALVACNNKDNALTNAPQGTPFEAGQQVTLTVNSANQGSQAPIRKINGTDNGSKISFAWEEGDKILVKVGEESAEFALKTGAGLTEATFEGTMPAEGSTFDVQYPVSPDLSSQTYVAGGVASGLMQFGSTGCSLGSAINLSATSSIIQLNLYGTDKTVGKIVFKKGSDSYTLTCGTGVAIGSAEASATAFYMVVPAGSYTFEAEVYDNAATPALICSLAPASAKTFTAGQTHNMSAKEVVEAPKCLCFTSVSGTSTVKFSNTSFNLEWSTDGATWEDDAKMGTKTLSVGQKLYIRANSSGNTTLYDSNSESPFLTEGNLKVSGNIMYLLNGTSPSTTITTSDCFRKLFKQQSITDASELILPATTLTQYCYYEMFMNCSTLVKAPALPATTLAHSCYYSMFHTCPNLTNAPSIDATTLANYCCYAMFCNCSSLEVAPTLYAKTLVSDCYNQMFKNCHKLSSVTMLATDISASYSLLLWLVDAGKSATSRTVYVANNTMVYDIKNWHSGPYYAIPDTWTVAVKP